MVSLSIAVVGIIAVVIVFLVLMNTGQYSVISTDGKPTIISSNRNDWTNIPDRDESFIVVSPTVSCNSIDQCINHLKSEGATDENIAQLELRCQESVCQARRK